ncbi:MAG: hypothetical protein V3U27_06125, partial [Candidatus Tectomicrobia bacterium]
MEHHESSLHTVLQNLVDRSSDLWSLNACGVTRSQTAIPSLVHRHAYVPTTDHTRVFVVAGLSGSSADVDLALQCVEAYLDTGPRLTDTLALSAVPCA